MSLADKIRNYPDNARVIVTWHRDGRWSEDAFPVANLKNCIAGLADELENTVAQREGYKQQCREFREYLDSLPFRDKGQDWMQKKPITPARPELP